MTSRPGDGAGRRQSPAIVASRPPRRRPRPVVRSAGEGLPDVRDGLTRLERTILLELARASKELGRKNVPTTLLHGRVVEKISVGVDEFQATLARLIGRVGK